VLSILCKVEVRQSVGKSGVEDTRFIAVNIIGDHRVDNELEKSVTVADWHYHPLIRIGLILTLVNVDVWPNVLAFAQHPGPSLGKACLHKHLNLLGDRILKTGID